MGVDRINKIDAFRRIKDCCAAASAPKCKSKYTIHFSLFTIHFLFLFALPAFSQQEEKELAVAFTGDILLDRGVRLQIEERGIESLFSPGMDSLLRSMDYVVGNLECPATKVKSPVFKRFVFRGEPEWLDALRRHGFTHLNLANNHTVDQGRRGLMSTAENVRKAGMTPFGADSTLAAATQPVLLSNTPRKVFLLSSVPIPLEHFPFLTDRPMPSVLSVDSLISRIRNLKSEHPGCCVIVSLHWGREHTLQPTLNQRHDAHRLAAAGADALVCHHPHTLQTVEHYHGVPIYYSIGNYIFDLTSDINRRGAVVILRIGKDSVDATSFPYTLQRCTPILDSPDK